MIKVITSVTALLAAGMAFAASYSPDILPTSVVAVVSAPVPIVQTTAPAWLDCAAEGQTCAVKGTVLVRYGVGDTFVTKEVTGSFTCGNDLFGDPKYGVVKSCSYAPVPAPLPAPTLPATDQWTACASEGQTCVVPGTAQVRYGARGAFATREARGQIACSNAVFGDPVYGIVKACAYRATSTPEASASIELPAIASNFDVNRYLVPSWGSGNVASTAAPDVVGAFRFICNPGQVLPDDPIVYPGQPGRSHLHQFFGNTAANANSTYASLRTTGDSTCNNMLNRSAYWIPAMMNGKGKVVRPDYVSIYYKRRPASDPECQRLALKGCRDLPRGLRYVFGYNMATDVGGAFHFNCDGPTGTQGYYPDIVAAAQACPLGNRLGAVVNAPQCWDGKNLDSTDHRSHMAYPGYGYWGYLKCPDTHPYALPEFTLAAWYTTDADLDRSGNWTPSTTTWHLSSDRMTGMPAKRPGSTLHADWFGAWDDDVMKMWSGNCVDKLLSCSGGDLGNGKQLRMFDGFSWNANPRLVDPPA